MTSDTDTAKMRRSIRISCTVVSVSVNDACINPRQLLTQTRRAAAADRGRCALCLSNSSQARVCEAARGGGCSPRIDGETQRCNLAYTLHTYTLYTGHPSPSLLVLLLLLLLPSRGLRLIPVDARRLLGVYSPPVKNYPPTRQYSHR